MYEARIETDAGEVVRFGYKYGTLFDISPLSGIDVDISTSQGFKQIGETVENQSVGGLNRTIKGVFVNNAKEQARQMIQALPPFTTGKLYYNDECFCYITVKKSPVILMTENNRKTTFTMLVYCHNPYWLKANQNAFVIGGYTPAFRFPVRYDTHRFGVAKSDAFVDIYNGGVAQSEFSIRFTALFPVENYGIVNVVTLEKLSFTDILDEGEIVDVYRKNGRLYVTKTANGQTEDIFSTLDDDSNLFFLRSGSNVLKGTAYDGADGLQISISFYEAQAGVANATY